MAAKKKDDGLDLAAALREKYLDDAQSKMQCRKITVNGQEFEYCWKPLTGAQQREIQSFANKSIAEGICAHVKVRAITRDGQRIFGNTPIASLMNDYNFEDDIMPMFGAMTGGLLDEELLAKN